MGEQVAAGLNGGVAQLGEHLPCKQGVKGSNPSTSSVSVQSGSQQSSPTACRHAIQSNLIVLMKASFQRPLKFACARTACSSFVP